MKLRTYGLMAITILIAGCDGYYFLHGTVIEEMQAKCEPHGGLHGIRTDDASGASKYWCIDGAEYVRRSVDSP